jgi:hypothetical protein
VYNNGAIVKTNDLGALGASGMSEDRVNIQSDGPHSPAVAIVYTVKTGVYAYVLRLDDTLPVDESTEPCSA